VLNLAGLDFQRQFRTRLSSTLSRLCNPVPNNQTVSLKFLLTTIVVVSLCLAPYPVCRIYSLVGAVSVLLISALFIRRLRSLVVAGGFTFAFIGLATMVDVLIHGPATQHHNQRLARIAQSNQLVGKSKETAISLLGVPTSTFDMTNGQTLNYAPFRYFPHGIFQVHCRSGVVISIELYDD